MLKIVANGKEFFFNDIVQGNNLTSGTAIIKGKSRVKTLAPIDLEVAKTLYDFVDRTVTEQRMEQGLQNLVQEQCKPFEMSSLGDFIRWVYNDIVKEEADVIEASKLDRKQLGPAIANTARKWYIEQYNTRELE